jgi:hypothetical protein
MNIKYHFIDRSHNFEEISAITYLHMDKIIGLPQPFRWLPTTYPSTPKVAHY